jgi:hypothetical protein
LVVLPTSPYPDFNISNSTINVSEDFGEMTFVKFVPSFDFGGGESNAEVPVYFEFSITNILDTLKPYSMGSSWSQVFMDVNNVGDLRIVSEPNQWGTLIASVKLTDSFASKGLNYSSPIRSFSVMISPVNDPPTFNFSSSEIIIPDNVSSYTAADVLRNIVVGPPDEILAQYIKSINCSLAPSHLSIFSAVVPSFNPSCAVCPSASISFTLLPFTSGSVNMSCCVTDTADGSSCQTTVLKILSDFHLLPQGDISVGSAPKDENTNVTIFSHVRVILPQDSNIPADANVPGLENVQFSFNVGNMSLFLSPPVCIMNGSSCNIVFALTPQNFGESVVHISAQYNNRMTSSFFKIRVGRVNQSPNFTIPFPDVSVLSGSNATTIPDFVVNVTAGAFDSDQSTSFVVQATNTMQASSAFAALPQISNGGILTFELKPSVYGTFRFSCTLIDSPSIPLDSLNSTLYFSIVVAFVNQAPSFFALFKYCCQFHCKCFVCEGFFSDQCQRRTSIRRLAESLLQA